MILCDIGNTHLHFYDKKTIWRVLPEKLGKLPLDCDVYYISVCEEHTQKLLKKHKNSFDISECIKIDTDYKGMGVDRRAACKSVSDGVIVDAGSAITIDVMHEGRHLGGCIMAGLMAYSKMFSGISSALDKPFNSNVPLDSLPKNTQDALSFGVFKGLCMTIQTLSEGRKIFFTGGDGKFLSKFFENSIYDEMLVFRGMELGLKSMLQRR